MMKISVIIPTYKPKDYLWECLDSLVNQTFPKENFEVILVLNGCEEPYKSDVEKYISRKMQGMNINFIHTLQGGVSNARNIALDQVKGEYVTFIDDDDYVSSNYLLELHSVASPTIISLAKPFAFDDVNQREKRYRITDEFIRCTQNHKCSFNDARKFFSGPWMKLIPMSFIGNRRFNIKFKNGEDSLFMYLISDKFNKVSFASEKAIYYRRYREGSAVMRKRTFTNRLSNGLKLLVEVLKIYIPNFWKYNFRFSFTTILSTIHGVFTY